MIKPEALPELKVQLSECKNGERAVALDYPENLGTRTKLGGEPEWIQFEDVPKCEFCDNLMTFVAQIDSIEHYSAENPNAKIYAEQKYMFGDVGMIYVFFCFECANSKSIFQGY